VGLFFFFPDYVLFLKELERNLKAPLRFVEQSKYQQVNPLADPVAEIGDSGIEIHFLHYPSAEQAERVWRERAARVDCSNADHIVVVAQEQPQDGCTAADVAEFGKLPFRHKFFFTVNQYDLPDTYFIPEFHKRGYFPNTYRKVLPVYRQFVRAIRTKIPQRG
jgi:uncharacterized protein (DUF1919 family)